MGEGGVKLAHRSGPERREYQIVQVLG
jgi:hypothetical protein